MRFILYVNSILDNCWHRYVNEQAIGEYTDQKGFGIIDNQTLQVSNHLSVYEISSMTTLVDDYLYNDSDRKIPFINFFKILCRYLNLFIIFELYSGTIEPLSYQMTQLNGRRVHKFQFSDWVNSWKCSPWRILLLRKISCFHRLSAIKHYNLKIFILF